MTLRPIELLRATWGAALLLAPRFMLERVNHVQVDTKSLVVARILGARQLTQAVLSGVSPSPEVLAMGVWVDAVHSATALALAGIDHDRARAGLTDAAVAGVWGGLGYRDLRTGSVPSPVHERRRDQLARWALGWLPGGTPLLAAARQARHRHR